MKNQSRTSIESLEQRIAPAAVTINAALHTATWTDFDGDLVTLKYSTAQAPTFDTTDNGAGLLVNKIVLDPTAHANGDFSIKVKAAGGGDGRVNIGRLGGTDVQIHDLIAPVVSFSEIDLGVQDTTANKIVVGTVGAIPFSQFTNTDGNGNSFINGAVKNLTIRGDIGATVLIVGDAPQPTHVTVTGNLNGAAAGGVDFAGNLKHFGGSNGSVKIGGNIIGGNGSSEGGLQLSNGGAVLIKGSVIGGAGEYSATIRASTLTSLTINGDLVGGSAHDAGEIIADVSFGILKIRGSVIGGSEFGAGHVYTTTGHTWKVLVGGSLVGGSSGWTGALDIDDVDVIKVAGSLVGAFGTHSPTNEITGGIRVNNNLGTLFIGGSIIGGGYATDKQLSYNGAVQVDGNLGSATIKGSVMGHDGYEAIIMAGGVAPATPGDYNAIGKLKIGGDVSYAYIAVGHTFNGGVFGDRVGAAENPDAGIGSVTVGGQWFHSNLSAGINDLTTNGVTQFDTRDTGDANLHAKIGKIVVKRGILDSPSATGFSGFLAEKIASITAGGVKLFKSGDPGRTLDAVGFVQIAEI